jgi:hypothetical protein
MLILQASGSSFMKTGSPVGANNIPLFLSFCNLVSGKRFSVTFILRYKWYADIARSMEPNFRKQVLEGQ